MENAHWAKLKCLINVLFILLFILVLFTVVLGVYPSLILNVLDYSMNSLIYSI